MRIATEASHDAVKGRAQGAKVILTHSRWCLLKRPENLSELQAIKLKGLVSCKIVLDPAPHNE